MNHAHIYCKTLEALTREEAIDGIHAALMQINAIEKGVENVDNKPIQRTLSGLLQKAGHIGYTDVASNSAPRGSIVPN